MLNVSTNLNFELQYLVYPEVGFLTLSGVSTLKLRIKSAQ